MAKAATDRQDTLVLDEITEDAPNPRAALAPSPDPAAPPAMDLALVVERLAANPSVDVEKLKQIIDLQERILNRQAESAFNRAFARMLPLIPTIDETASTDKTTYAPLEEIVEKVKPVCAAHGFSFGWETEWLDNPTRVKVTCTLTHEDGHARWSVFVSAADNSGSKNAIQALGSAVHYGRRYTLRDLLAIVTRKDDDGKKGGGDEVPEMPSGFRDFVMDLQAKADEGTEALNEAWAAINKSLASKAKAVYLVQHEKPTWEKIKAKAADATKKASRK